MSWGPGHDYGGIISLKNMFPWDEPDSYAGDTAARAPTNPWHIPKIKRYLESSRLEVSATQSKEERSMQARGNIQESSKQYPAMLTNEGSIISNCFTELPLEILEFILAFVPTEGVKSLARSSRGLNMTIPSSLGQYFWASRFQDTFDCGFVFEAQTYEHGIDWRSLYFSTIKDRSSRIQNRRRIWGLIGSLSELLCLHWNDDQGLLLTSEDESKLGWKEVHGWLRRLNKEWDTFCSWRRRPGPRIDAGCLRLYSQYISIPTLMRCIVVSTVSTGTATYITGLCFKQETKICLGYTSGTQLSLETSGLRGFILAVGSRGIHAIQFVNPTGQLSQWFGNPEGVPITRRLVSDEPITAIKAGFDVSSSGFLIIYC